MKTRGESGAVRAGMRGLLGGYPMFGVADVTPCGIRVGFSISHYIWVPFSGRCRRLVIYEPRDQPDVGTAAGHPLALRSALQAEGHQPHYRQCLHSVATSRFPLPQVVPVVAG